MKSEREIRAYLKDLRRHAVPCRYPHATAAEREECRQGLMGIAAAIATLAWVLGENPGHDRVVEEFAKARQPR